MDILTIGEILIDLTQPAALRWMPPAALEPVLAFANRAASLTASLTASRHGAIPAMPTLEEIRACRNK